MAKNNRSARPAPDEMLQSRLPGTHLEVRVAGMVQLAALAVHGVSLCREQAARSGLKFLEKNPLGAL